MTFVAAQIGARRAYAVPAILERAGCLERFYTDLCADVGLGKWFVVAGSASVWGGRFQGLASRHLPAAIREKTRTFSGPVVRYGLRRAWGGADPVVQFRLRAKLAVELGLAAAAAGFGRATHLYAMFTEFPELMVAARKRGLTVVCEVYLLLSTERIMAEECRRFPDWEPEPPDWAALRRRFVPEDLLSKTVDHYICPSERVRDDLVKECGVAADRCSIVPYGVHASWLELAPRPQRGRVLFAGTAGLGKGIHYLAMAAQQLRARGRSYDFRVAGHVTPQVARQPACQSLRFLGRVPRDRIAVEFQHADVFVLPSLAEGSAESTYEALATGVPVIATPAAGSVARDGLEGRIVPERSVEALAEAIESLIEDRPLRDQMAYAGRERARDYTWERYGQRLIRALGVASS